MSNLYNDVVSNDKKYFYEVFFIIFLWSIISWFLYYIFPDFFIWYLFWNKYMWISNYLYIFAISFWFFSLANLIINYLISLRIYFPSYIWLISLTFYIIYIISVSKNINNFIFAILYSYVFMFFLALLSILYFKIKKIWQR